jgi:hypothetical protein
LAKGESDRDSLSVVELARFDNYRFSRFGAFENVIGNFAEGFVPDKEYEVWAVYFRHRFGKKGYRQFWFENRDGFFASFRAWADEQYEMQAK